jgi:hypothetical protein
LLLFLAARSGREGKAAAAPDDQAGDKLDCEAAAFYQRKPLRMVAPHSIRIADTADIAVFAKSLLLQSWARLLTHQLSAKAGANDGIENVAAAWNEPRRCML